MTPRTCRNAVLDASLALLSVRSEVTGPGLTCGSEREKRPEDSGDGNLSLLGTSVLLLKYRKPVDPRARPSLAL